MKTIDEKTKGQESNTNKDLINLLTLYYLQYTFIKIYNDSRAASNDLKIFVNQTPFNLIGAALRIL